MTPPAAASSTASAAPLAPRRRPATRRPPRRVSGPVRAPSRAAPQRRARNEGAGLVLNMLAALEALSSHRLLDRLIRGRLWIGIVAFALIGIVTLQLGLLRLNSGIGRALEKAGGLQRTNAALQIEDSELAAGARVESQAERLGMRLTAVGGLRFHESHARSDVPQAAAALKEAIKPAEAHGSETTSAASDGAAVAEGAEQSGSDAATPEEAASDTAAHEGASAPEAAATAPAQGDSGEATQPAASPAAGEAAAGAEAGGGGTAAPGG